MWIVLYAFVVLSASPAEATLQISREERDSYIRKAEIWSPTEIAKLDLLQGPQGTGAYPFNHEVSCVYKKKQQSGSTSKFSCVEPGGRTLKVRYDLSNGEVYSQPAATRLLWALGFGAVRSYPVRVYCRGCPEDPFVNPDEEVGDYLFDPATLDEKLDGEVMEEADKEDQGWKWSELNQIREEDGGATRSQVDALKLLAAFMQHGDNQARQQRLICLPGGLVQEGNKKRCLRPFMYVYDVGSTFGGSQLSDERAKMNLAEWAAHPIWRDPLNCIADLSAPSGGMRHPRISEKGRRFLAELLSQLTDRQISDLFRAARADRRDQNENGFLSARVVSVSEWVRIFKEKRDQIVRQRCPR